MQISVNGIYSRVAWNLDLHYKMAPPMRKLRIWLSDPEATDSSDDEDDQNRKKGKKLIAELPLPQVQSSSYRDTEEEAAAAYQEKWERYNAEKLAMKAQLPVPVGTALSSSTSLSCVSTSMSCKQKAQEVHTGVKVTMDTESTDERVLNFSPTPKVTSVDVSLSQIDEPVGDSVVPADKPSPEDVFPVNDFVVGVNEPPDDDYIGLADLSHLPLPFEVPEFDPDAEPDWSVFDLDSLFNEDP